MNKENKEAAKQLLESCQHLQDFSKFTDQKKLYIRQCMAEKGIELTPNEIRDVCELVAYAQKLGK